AEGAAGYGVSCRCGVHCVCHGRLLLFLSVLLDHHGRAVSVPKAPVALRTPPGNAGRGNAAPKAEPSAAGALSCITDQCLSAFVIRPGTSRSPLFCMSGFSFRASFPSPIFQSIGSPSNFAPTATPYAQKPPECGTYVSGFASKAWRYAWVAQR